MLTGAANPLLSPTARLCWMQVRPDDLCVFTNVLLCIFGVSSTPALHLTFFFYLFLILVVHHSVALMLKCLFFSPPTSSPSPSSSPTSADPGLVQSLSQSLMSSRAAAAAVARGSRGLWLWLALLLVLAGKNSLWIWHAVAFVFRMWIHLSKCKFKGCLIFSAARFACVFGRCSVTCFATSSAPGLLALLASLVMQPVVDAAPVGTGDSWMTIQQLLWPYTGLRHNGQPPV